MMRLLTRLPVVLALALLVTAAAPPRAHAQSNKEQPAKEQLKAQFKAREMELRDLKQKGRIGETLEGYVETVPGTSGADAKTTQLVSDENRDRKQLYQMLADEINREHPSEKVKATVETIASRNALRNIEKAGPEEMLRVGRDHWIRVKDYPRFQRVATLKSQGKVGETAAGLVEIVRAEDRSDTSLVSTVSEENSARAAEYKSLAEKEHTDAPAIGKRMGKRNFDNARAGEMLKDDGGAWRKK